MLYFLRHVPKNWQAGQTTVVILLIMVVVLTIGLSVTARSITDVRISSQTEQSTRAFSAAEAGVEDALRRGLSVIANTSSGKQTVGTGNATYQYNVQPVGGANYAPNKPVAQDDVVQLKLDPTGLTNPFQGIAIYWIAPGENCNLQDTNPGPASLEVTIVYGTAPTYTMLKRAYSVTSARNDGFTIVTAGSYQIGGNGAVYCGKVADLTNFAGLGITNPRLLRIRPLYNAVSLAVAAAPENSGYQLPVQSYRVRSEGEAGGVRRTVEVTQSVPVLPAIFDYVLYSGAGLTK